MEQNPKEEVAIVHITKFAKVYIIQDRSKSIFDNIKQSKSNDHYIRISYILKLESKGKVDALAGLSAKTELQTFANVSRKQLV